jgi:hypothetical protein
LIGRTSGTQQYTNGTGSPGVTIWQSDTNITITEGHGGTYPLGFGFSPRRWNGIIHYGDTTNLYTFSWSNGATSEDISNLSLGSYSVTVTDCIGCSESGAWTVLNNIIYGCTDPAAFNYNSAANTDDGSCVYAGCTDPAACNYDANASIDDGSCDYSCTTTCDAKPTGINMWGITDTRFYLGWDNMNTSSCMVLKYNVRFRETGTATWTTRSAGAGNGQCNFGLNNVEKLMINFLPSTTYDLRLRVQYCGTGGAWSAWTSTLNVTMADACPDLANMQVQTFNGQQNKAKFTWDTTRVYNLAKI